MTEKKFAAFKQWLSDAGYGVASIDVLLEGLAAVVRFADRSLLPSRGIAERQVFADATTEGTIEWFMVNEFFPVNGAIASPSTRHHYGIAVARLSKYLGRPAALSDLTDGVFRRWLSSMQRDGLRFATLRGYAFNLRAFWKWAAERRLVDEEPADDVVPPAAPKTIKQKLDPCGAGSLSQFVDRYFSSRDVSAVYETKVRKRASKLARFAGSVSIEEIFELSNYGE